MEMPRINPIGKTAMATITCPIHGEYHGWTTIVGGELINSVCDKCFEEAEDKIRQARNVETRINQNRDIFNKSCLPPRFTGITFDHFKTNNEEMKHVKATFERYVNAFGQTILQRGISFLFSGNTGTGKTLLASAIANGVMSQGYPAIYISSLNYLSKIKTAWTAGAEHSEDYLIESYVKYPLLILDEIGKGTLDNKEKSMIFRLIDRRYEEKKPTIGISKFNRDTVIKMIDDDTVRRLESGGGATICFTWDKYQEERLI
jgi:DNA replication protein DnaC